MTSGRKLLLSAIALGAMLPGLDRAQDRRMTPVAVSRRQALVIGNGAYANAALKNPLNDAQAMSAALRRLGFDDVRTLTNLDLAHMEAAIDDFTARLSAGSLAFVYFSGHGVQVANVNYLLPIDFAAASEVDVKYKAYPATRIQEKLEASGARLRVMVLDACRNNPFRYNRSLTGGLAAMPVDAEGTLIAFATGDNNTADDNAAEANGVYTKHLIPALLTPGLQIQEAFRKAKENVYFASQKKQNPSVYENVIGAFYLAGAPTGGAPVAGPPVVARIDPAAATWDLIKNSQHAEDFDEFAKSYPSSDLAPGARIRAAQLRRDAAGATVPAPGPAPATGAPVESAYLTVSPVRPVKTSPGGISTITVVAELKAGYHAMANQATERYLIPLTLNWGGGPAKELRTTYPRSTMEKYSFSDKPISVVTGRFAIVTAFQAPSVAGTFAQTGTLRYQACDDRACYPPKSVPVSVTVEVE